MAEIKPVNVVEMTLGDRGRKAVATVPDFTPYLRFTVHKKDSAWLVTVFNYHPSQDLLARIALPAIPRSGAWHVFSLKDRKAYSTANRQTDFSRKFRREQSASLRLQRRKGKRQGILLRRLWRKNLPISVPGTPPPPVSGAFVKEIVLSAGEFCPREAVRC